MNSGIVEIDTLFVNPSAQPVDTSNRPVVAAVQALLAGHGFRGMPTLLDSSSGMFGPVTHAALSAFRESQQLPDGAGIDSASVRALVTVPAATPIISRPYVALVLDVAFTGVLPIAIFTMALEGNGAFGAANLNTDRCGLSFGLIQWAQRPGRLHELLLAWDTADPDLFTRVFGEGDADLARALLTHTAKPSGGVDARTGVTVDARFDLVAEPWRSRFASAAREPAFQRQQIASAVEAFERSLATLRQHVPVVISERGFTAMLDVANQFGDGGALSVAAAVLEPGVSEADFLLAVQAETVSRVGRQYRR